MQRIGSVTKIETILYISGGKMKLISTHIKHTKPAAE